MIPGTIATLKRQRKTGVAGTGSVSAAELTSVAQRTRCETKRGIRSEVAENPVLGGLQTLLRSWVLLRVPDPEDDLAGLVGCARQHGLRLARLGKRQD